MGCVTQCVQVGVLADLDADLVVEPLSPTPGRIGAGPGRPRHQPHAQWQQSAIDRIVSDAADHHQLVVRAAGPANGRHGRVHPGVRDVADRAEFGSEVGDPDGDHVHPVDRGDLLGVRDPRRCFQHHLHDHLRALRFRGLRTLSPRREAAGARDQSRFAGGFDAGRDDTVRTRVQYAADDAVLALLVGIPSTLSDLGLLDQSVALDFRQPQAIRGHTASVGPREGGEDFFGGGEFRDSREDGSEAVAVGALVGVGDGVGDDGQLVASFVGRPGG